MGGEIGCVVAKQDTMETKLMLPGPSSVWQDHMVQVLL